MYGYKGGLFGCFGDIKSCLFSFFLPPIQNGWNLAKSRDEECTLCHCCLVVHPYWTRKIVLKKEGDTGNDLMDCIFTDICMPCTIAQDARALF